jgi:hypothetical protein
VRVSATHRLKRSIEEHVPYLMKINATQLVIAAGLLSLPFPAYVPYWLFGLGVAVELVLAGKLSSVTTLLAAKVRGRRAWRRCTRAPARPGAGSRWLPLWCHSLSALGFWLAGTPDLSTPPIPPLHPAPKSLMKFGDEAALGTPAAATMPTPGPPVADPPVVLTVTLHEASPKRQLRQQQQAAAAGAYAAPPLSRPYLDGRRGSVHSSPMRGGQGLSGSAPPPEWQGGAPEPLRVAPRRMPTGSSGGGSGPSAPQPPPPPGPPPLGSRAITKRIGHCQTLEELEAFVAAYSEAFNQLHVSLSLLQLHKLAQRRSGPGDGEGGARGAGGGGGGGGGGGWEPGVVAAAAAAAAARQQRPPPGQVEMASVAPTGQEPWRGEPGGQQGREAWRQQQPGAAQWQQQQKVEAWQQQQEAWHQQEAWRQQEEWRRQEEWRQQEAWRQARWCQQQEEWAQQEEWRQQQRARVLEQQRQRQANHPRARRHRKGRGVRDQWPPAISPAETPGGGGRRRRPSSQLKVLQQDARSLFWFKSPKLLLLVRTPRAQRCVLLPAAPLLSTPNPPPKVPAAPINLAYLSPPPNATPSCTHPPDVPVCVLHQQLPAVPRELRLLAEARQRRERAGRAGARPKGSSSSRGVGCA